jgi:DNA-binding NarL/FixJ family response regulator
MEPRDNERSGTVGPIRVLIVDDHPLLRNGVRELIVDQPDVQVAGEAANGREAIEQYRRLRPDITLMDLQMPGLSGFDALLTIRSEFPQAAVIALTTYSGDAHVVRALKAGARAYLLKNTHLKELLDCIRVVHAGKKTISPDALVTVAEHAMHDSLTEGEITVLRFVAEGNSNKQIGNRLRLAEDTVKGRMKNILAKLGATDRTQAVMIALRRGFIEL